MSEEEKKTIEYLELFIKTDINYCRLEKIDVTNILNVIKKQQKEIEELEKERESLIQGHKMAKHSLIVLDGREYISKDKIREKIKELNGQTQKLIDKNGELLDTKQNYTIRILKELLEED